MDAERAVRWLHRRAGWGLPADQLQTAIQAGPTAELDRLLAQPPSADFWDDSALPLEQTNGGGRVLAIHAWLEGLIGSASPLVERLAWIWHGHLVSGLDKVRIGRLMATQIRLFRSAGMGPFADLLRAVTIDPAMMLYLDLRRSTAAAPNENYARELLELFTLGVGNYSEADVKAGAKALSGWRQMGETVRFVARQHDDAPQQYLGASGVHDLDTVISAVMAHPAMPGFVAASVAGELIGEVTADVAAALAEAFTRSDFDVAALVRATLQAGLDGAGSATMLSPVAWLVNAQRVTGAVIRPKPRLKALTLAGQVPMVPPSVAGWPGGKAWMSASCWVGRGQLAGLIGEVTPAGSAVAVAADGTSSSALAGALGLGEDFSATTQAALRGARTPAQRISTALLSPEFVIAEVLR